MKSAIAIALVICLLTTTTKANFQTVSFNIIDTSSKASLSSLLTLYYELKDDLVNDNASAASTTAAEFLSAINNIDTKLLSTSDAKIFTQLQSKLAFDARHISEVKSIGHQREHFASLSSNMYELAKNVKLSGNPVYQQYCPMKKSYWLSNETKIKNPYYGKQMLTCGKVSRIL